MTTTYVFLVVIAAVGATIYYFVKDGKVAELGRILFFAALLAVFIRGNLP